MRMSRRVVELRSLIEAYPATRPAYPDGTGPPGYGSARRGDDV